jgi:hypothetical protein
MTTRSFLSLAVLILGFAPGCGSYPPPTERLTTAEAAIRGAEEVGASRVPRAALHMQLAKEQTEKARRLMQDSYNERAELTLKRAQADAELAISISKEHETVQRAQQTQAKLDQLKAAQKEGGQ